MDTQLIHTLFRFTRPQASQWAHDSSEGQSMEIVYSKNLTEYMLEKGRPHILIEACESKSCGGPLAFLKARAVGHDEMACALPRAKAAYQGLVGRVLVMANGFDFGDKIELGLHSFFGIKDIAIENTLALV